MKNADYRVELRIDGKLIGDVRRLAQNLTWIRRRTMYGVDEIDFTLNDVLFEEWLQARGTTINSILKPLALDCRIVRDGVDILGGFLATMPAYTPNGTSANLALRFDGYLNYLGGVYIRPTATTTARMGEMVSSWIQGAETRATNAGRGFGFTAGTIDTLPTVTQTFDGYKTVKDAIADRCDNVSGAGKFDVYFHTNRTYDIISDENFGITQPYTVQFPAQINGISAITIQAQEVSGFASHVIAIGSGETSSDPAKSTAIISEATNSDAVTTYGYYETLLQNSSVERQATLDINCATELANVSDTIWQPEITLTGRQINPSPTGNNRIWLGDTIMLQNNEDLTGMTNGAFRVQELSVTVTATGAETITPTLERVV